MSDEIEQTPDIIEVMRLQRERLWSDDAGGELGADMEALYHLWWRWADFHLYLTSPIFPTFKPPRVILPALIEGTTDTYEFVYPIVDYGNRFSTSKGIELYTAGLSMWKLYCTIEKIVNLLIERIKETDEEGASGGASSQTEFQVAFAGHELAQRKGFESIINLSYNVVVTNFDPGPWGERYLLNVKRLADKGYGYPSAAPRDFYKHLPMVKTAPK